MSRAPRFRTGGSHGKPEYVSSLQGNLSNAELEGPLQGQPLDALVHAIQEGNHTPVLSAATCIGLSLFGCRDLHHYILRHLQTYTVSRTEEFVLCGCQPILHS